MTVKYHWKIGGIMQQHRYVLSTLILASFLPFLGWATDWATPGGPAGLIKPGPNGPFRNDPAQGIPKHAYSPFDQNKQAKTNALVAGRDFLPGRVVVKLKSPAAAQSMAATALPDVAALRQKFAAHGVTSLDRVFPNVAAPAAPAKAATGTSDGKPDLTRWLRAKCADDQDVRELAAKLAADPEVEYAEPDMIRRPAGDPLPSSTTDPLFDQQWHLAATHVPEAWAYLQSLGLPPGGNRDIVVAVIDTGVDYTHPDLAANIWVNSREIAGNSRDDDGNGFVDDVHGACVVGTHSGDPNDDHGHGTHVAGIIAAQGRNNQGGVGVAYNVQIMAIKAAQYSGVLAASDIAEGINYAVANGADIINMSFGGYAESQVEKDALVVAFGQCVLVAAAGNDGMDNDGGGMYPAKYNWVLGVMARTQGKRCDLANPDSPVHYLADFSNWDSVPGNTSEYELMAPGVDIWSTLPNNQYAAWGGTSMAAPVVSGIAALLRTRFPDKDTYSSRFIMGQLAGCGPLLLSRCDGQYYRSADASSCLTSSPQPALSFLQFYLFDTTAQAANNDSDGIIDNGETIDLAIVIRNHWGKADSVTVTLEAQAEGAYQPDPYVTMLTNTADYGAIGAFNWDDNGLIYDANGIVTGVRHPFRFQVATNCPNDHQIPFLLTMRCRNGFDTNDATDCVFQDRFYLAVQNGRVLPWVITNDMVLTKDYYWIVPLGTVQVREGVTITISEGTQVQWGTPLPTSPYYYPPPSTAILNAGHGQIIIRGTLEDQVELFPLDGPGQNSYCQFVCIGNLKKEPFRTLDAHYTRFLRPLLDLETVTGYSLSDNHFEHCWFYGGDVFFGANKVVHSNQVTKCIIAKRDRPSYQIVGNADTCYVTLGGEYGGVDHYQYFSANPFRNCVFGKQHFTSAYFYTFPDAASARTNSLFVGNAFLSPLWQPDFSQWTEISGRDGYYLGLTSNYWGTASPFFLNKIIGYDDRYGNPPTVVYDPVLPLGSTNTYPFVADFRISTAAGSNVLVVGAESATFTVTYNRDMDTNVQPMITFGPDTPLTDYTVHPIGGGWESPRTWVGVFHVGPITGDGYQLMRFEGGRAADDPFLVVMEDAARFRFEIITSGTEAMNLQAMGGEGRVDLTWSQDDFDLLAGYNLYRSTATNGTFIRVNKSVIPAQTKSFRDTNVVPA